MTLQIFNFNTETWRLGAALPEPRMWTIGVVADGKLFLISTAVDSSRDLLVYDPQSNSWTEAAPPPAVTNSLYISRACAHKGRLVVFLSDGTACERADDCPVPLTVRGTQTLVSFAPLAFKLFFAARQNAVLRRSPFPSP